MMLCADAALLLSEPVLRIKRMPAWSGRRTGRSRCRLLRVIVVTQTSMSMGTVVTLSGPGSDNLYTWRGVCDGWTHVDGVDSSIKEERIPPGTAERRHVHHLARQLFYVLEGTATMSTSDGDVQLHPHAGYPIAPGQPHQMCNDSCYDVRFLVISNPTSRGDRLDLNTFDAC